MMMMIYGTVTSIVLIIITVMTIPSQHNTSPLTILATPLSPSLPPTYPPPITPIIHYYSSTPTHTDNGCARPYNIVKVMFSYI